MTCFFSTLEFRIIFLFQLFSNLTRVNLVGLLSSFVQETQGGSFNLGKIIFSFGNFSCVCPLITFFPLYSLFSLSRTSIIQCRHSQTNSQILIIFFFLFTFFVFPLGDIFQLYLLILQFFFFPINILKFLFSYFECPRALSHFIQSTNTTFSLLASAFCFKYATLCHLSGENFLKLYFILFFLLLSLSVSLSSSCLLSFSVCHSCQKFSSDAW